MIGSAEQSKLDLQEFHRNVRIPHPKELTIKLPNDLPDKIVIHVSRQKQQET